MSTENKMQVVSAGDAAITAAGEYSKQLVAIAQLTIDGLQSEHSQRAYQRAIKSFLDWWQNSGEPQLNKAAVRRYLAERKADGLGTASYNQGLSAIKKMVSEAADNSLMPEQAAQSIARIESIKHEGVRAGNWLTIEQAQALINSPDVSTLAGKRDRAILALLIGTGIRRSELCSLTFEHIVQREGRWVLIDLIGKRGKVRTVPVPSWAKHALDVYAQAAGLSDGLIFRRINKSDVLAGESLTAQAIYYLVAKYSEQEFGEAGMVQPHDLRRTFAKLARHGGAQLEQISITLGHASLRTTQQYLGSALDLQEAACDKIGLHVNGVS